jgi:hypothetical protein
MKDKTKKIISILLCIITVLMLPFATINSSAANGYLIGDVDKNNNITAADARKALRFSARLETPTTTESKLADMDADGNVTASDARRILRISAQLENIEITVVGMRDTEHLSSYWTFHSWVDSSTLQNAQDIGGTQLNDFSSASATAVRDRIANSSYYAIVTHGEPTYITCYDGSTRSDFSTDTVNSYSGNFNYTKCILLAACSTAEGGAANPNNLVNTLQRKGARSVVGFKEEVMYYATILGITGSRGYPLFAREFTKAAAEKQTVEAAAIAAKNAVFAESNYTTYYGTDSYYVAGDGNLVISNYFS